MTRRSSATRPPRVVSLYTGAGGLDFGFEAAGFQTVFCIDFDKDSCATVRANRQWHVLSDDIHSVSPGSCCNQTGIRPGDFEVLIGGPPCQPFSKAAYWVNGDSQRLDDPRARTLHAYMEWVEALLPKVFLLENVHGISYSGKEEGFLLLQELTSRINRRTGAKYELAWKVLNADDYGVPQTRTRFFMVGHREGGRFRFPLPTHGRSEEHEEGQRRLAFSEAPGPVTAWDAIGGLKPPAKGDLTPKGYWADLLPSIPEGENYLWHTKRKGGLSLFGWRTRFWSFLLKLAKDRPSWTLQAQPGPAIGPFHWNNRLLSVEEMARLQTFPKNLHYVGSRLSVQRQLGNAVPSLLAEVLAREIAYQFFDQPKRGKPTLHVRLKKPIPPPEPVTPVAEKYLVHLGDHPDHPGEGKGRRATRPQGVSEPGLGLKA